ncbi:Sporulation kinase E [Rosistilla carotiformis]|uniref:histidine kinase n=1 Tax=Rosistilla carotiformis TaxID=2528017 RepID=A0A518JSV2_9BACT|nr:HAMP domain-containing sensor histidine kinase [Rosistilla carotiformis]QDV68623.1 Sporulation kinase E [Rosistilla carotiformis]
MKIAFKMMLVSLSVIATVTWMLSWFLLQQQEAVFLARAEEVAGRFADQATGTLAARPASERHKICTEMSGIAPVAIELHSRWVWFDEQSHRGGPRVAVEIQSLRRQQLQSVPIRDAEGQLQLFSYIPVETDQPRPGGLEFVQTMDQLTQARRDSMRAIWILAAAVMVSSTLAVGVASIYFLASPLQRLTSKVSRIADGDLSGPLQGHARDELGELADGINAMCERLTETQAAVDAETAAKVAAIEQLRHEDRLRTVGRLASGIAHELGTPLNVIQGRAQLIQSTTADPSQIETSAGEIIKESKRMTTIIRQLLDFARRDTPRRIVCPLNQIAEQTIVLLKPLAQRRGVSLECLADDNVLGHVDANQIQQVLTNLIVNAIDASDDGGRVTVRVARHDERAVIEVSDAGHGIDNDDIQQVFEPFYTTKPVGEGTGLGLSIVTRIVQEHGGRIDVESEPGVQTTFRIELPVAPTAPTT